MIDSIRAKIAESTDEAPLAAHLQITLAGPAGPPDGATIAEAIDMCRSYIQLVPGAVQDVMESGAATGTLPHVLPLLEAVGRYFLEEQDVVPDHLGVLGVLDDAFLANCTLQILSTAAQQLAGLSLLADDLGPANQAVATCLGPAIATALVQAADGAVSEQIYGPLLQGARQAGYAPQTGGSFEDQMSSFAGEFGHMFDGGGDLSALI